MESSEIVRLNLTDDAAKQVLGKNAWQIVRHQGVYRVSYRQVSARLKISALSSFLPDAVPSMQSEQSLLDRVLVVSTIDLGAARNQEAGRNGKEARLSELSATEGSRFQGLNETNAGHVEFAMKSAPRGDGLNAIPGAPS